MNSLGKFLALALQALSKTQQGQALLWSILSFLFFGALILGIPAIIVCVTILIACSGLPKLSNSYEEQKDKLVYWLYFYLITYWISMVLSIFCDPTIYAEDVVTGEMTEDEVTELVGRWSMITLVAAIISWVGLYYFIVRLWSQIPKDIAHLTAQNAAWFSIIPIFNFYGWFVTFCGLFNDMNKTAQRYGQSSPIVATEFAVVICLFWIGSVLVDFILDPHGDLKFFLILTDLVFTTAFFIYLYNNMVKLLALECNAPSA
jgi:hypothetical protein